MSAFTKNCLLLLAIICLTVVASKQQKQQKQESTTSDLPKIPIGKNGLNDTLYWGTYMPHVYFGMKSRSPIPISTGLVWSTPNVNDQFQRFLYKANQGSDGQYHWKYHDGKMFGVQEIQDTNGKINITTTFIKKTGSKGGDWSVRISGIAANDQLQETPLFSMMYYIRDESIEPKKGGLKVTTQDDTFKGDVQVTGNHPEIGDYTLHFSKPEDSTLPKGTFLKNQRDLSRFHYYGVSRHDKENYDIVGSIFSQETKQFLQPSFEEWIGLKKSTTKSKVPPFIPTLPNQLNDNSNIVIVQRVLTVPFDIEITFISHENHNNQVEDIGSIVKDLTSTQFDKLRDSYIDSFKYRFNQKLGSETYRLRPKGALEFSQTTLSNLLGGIGYWYGSGITEQKNQIVKTKPVALFSASPSRPAFPRGFLWDEGFHQILVSAWDVDLTIECLSHWFNIMDKNGWIPREQILGEEAASMVPKEFRLQLPHIANPPSLLLAVNKLLLYAELFKQNHSSNQLTAIEYENINQFLKESFPRLQRFYQYYWKTQSGNVDGLFRWRGRQINHTLASGLDDYPRPSPPTDSELHVDLSSWVAFFANSLSKISHYLKKDAESTQYFNDYNKVLKNIDLYHWDPETNRYQDVIYHSNNQTKEYFRTHGYINYFPMILSVIPEDSKNFLPLLDTLKNPRQLWSRYGIRSLSVDDKHYGTNENYWRGPIWFNINYLFIHSLSTKYTKSSCPHKESATDIYYSLQSNMAYATFSQFQETGFIYEQYDPITGEGKRIHPFNGWTSLVTLLLSEKV
ncbi:hypothetical protein CYY_005571 [Polysphondylium violaceum]|uniref:Mannosyl-oligosaccharide glucosidase n=1 Tax=Polysphondylium violaceum TaxID=133409 RepID=A0A8J4PUV8_9MYCE|nr:hypothetical protein CYY_005571 [Polysphondylium violaceum]